MFNLTKAKSVFTCFPNDTNHNYYESLYYIYAFLNKSFRWLNEQ